LDVVNGNWAAKTLELHVTGLSEVMKETAYTSLRNLADLALGCIETFALD
jgi:hypothetical protein